MGTLRCIHFTKGICEHCFREIAVSQITDTFGSATGLLHAHAWVIIMLFVLISETCENEREETISCCQSLLEYCKFGETGPWSLVLLTNLISLLTNCSFLISKQEFTTYSDSRLSFLAGADLRNFKREMLVLAEYISCS